MPQLDIVSFFSQYVWLMVFYIGFYLILVNTYLPKLSRILKVRSSKINAINSPTINSLSLASREQESINRFKFVQSELRQSVTNINNWIEKTVVTIRNKKNNELFKDLLATSILAQASITRDLNSLKGLNNNHKYHNKVVLSLIK